MKLIIVYDNKSLRKDLIADWGFSCLISYRNKNILFDTGANEEILRKNLMNLNLEKIYFDFVVFSHFHYDHVGGLNAIIQKARKFFVLDSFPKNFKQKLKEREEVKNVLKIDESLTLVKLPNFIDEQFLIVRTQKGLIVITGCAHPGILKILKTARKFGKIYLTIGGFHLFQKSENEIKEIARRMKKLSEKVAPAHCSGDLAKEIFYQFFNDDLIKVGVGKIIEIEEDLP